MRRGFLLLLLFGTIANCFAQDWKDFPVPADAGEGREWVLQDNVSDDFNYDFAPTSNEATIGNKWTNFYHNGWTGPQPTVWKRDHIYVEDGKMKVKASRTEGETVNVNSEGTNYTLKTTNLGCATSTKRVKYPVYIETYVKITKSVLASDVWLLSPDDTQEIDICEAYGSDRYTNEWFSNNRLHLSHHVFIRNPFQDWQPSDEGSFYTDGSTVWSDGYHRIGVYWKDPWNLEYYVDGQLVRTRSGKNQIDPNDYTNGTGLNKPMDIIINTEDQTWRAVQGLTPTDEELQNTENTTFNVDWVRVYKPVNQSSSSVEGVNLDKTSISASIGDKFHLSETVSPIDAADISVTWSSDKPEIASVSNWGYVECKAEGTAIITVTTNDGQKTATCEVTVSGGTAEASLSFDDETKYKNTEFIIGSTLDVSCNFHAGTGNTVVDGDIGGVKFWLRELTSGWGVVNDYVVSDSTAIGKTSGTASASISLNDVTPTSELPAGNFYFLFVNFHSSDGTYQEKGLNPIKIVRPTSIDLEPVSKSFNVYPNPTNGYLKLEFSQGQNNVQLSIYSLTGTRVFTELISGSSHELNLSPFPKGIYFLALNSENLKATTKIILR